MSCHGFKHMPKRQQWPHVLPRKRDLPLEGNLDSTGETLVDQQTPVSSLILTVQAILLWQRNALPCIQGLISLVFALQEVISNHNCSSPAEAGGSAASWWQSVLLGKPLERGSFKPPVTLLEHWLESRQGNTTRIHLLFTQEWLEMNISSSINQQIPEKLLALPQFRSLYSQ